MKKKSFLSRLFSKETEGTDPPQAPREFVAEQLEARILYSGAPVETEMPDAPAQEAPVVGESSPATFETLDGFGDGQIPATETEVSASDMVILSSFENLTQDEINQIADAAVERWKQAGLDESQVEALEAIKISMVDLDGLNLGEADGYDIYLDWNAAGNEWFIDQTPFLDEEFEFAESSTAFRDTDGDAQYGMDLLTVMMHEMGHVIGLEDLYGIGNELNIMHGDLAEGQRILPMAGQADGATAGSVEGIHRLTVPVTDGATLRTAIDAIESVDGTNGDPDYVIQLAAGNYDVSTGTELQIRNRTVNVVIEGLGATAADTVIDANFMSRVFEINEGSNVTFRNLTITRGNITNSHGGGVYIDNSDVIFDNVTITNNSASTNESRYGAGFYAQGIDTSVTFLGTVNITNNFAAGYGGGFFVGQNVVVNGSGATAINITGNQAGNDGKGFTRVDRDGGGFVANDHSQVTLANAKINNNGSETNGRDGGGFWSAGNSEVTLTDSEVLNNSAYEDGGGFYQADRSLVTISNTKIEGNTAFTRDGGGFRTTSALNETTITGGTLKNNVATSSSGGGFYNQGIVTITGLDITGNDAGNQGGGFYNSYQGAKVTLTDVNLTNNVSDNDGGGFYNHRGDVEFKLSANTTTNITGNMVTVDDRNGGAFRTSGSGGTVTIEKGFIQNNTSTGYGGGIYAGGETVITINDGEISGNVMNTTRGDRDGGGIYITEAATVSLTNTSVKDHTSRRYGGGVAVVTGSAIFNMTGGEISGNKSNEALNNNSGFGGGIWSIGGTNLTNVNVINNEALGEGTENVYGGGLAIQNRSGAGTFTNVNLQNNTAWHHGGGLFFVDAVIEWTGGEISGNEAGNVRSDAATVGAGGYIGGESEITLTNVVTKNHVIETHGGGFYLTNRSILTIDGGEVSSNRAGIATDGTVIVDGGDGGGILATEDSRLVLKGGVKIDSNVAEEHGGGFYVASDRTIVQIEGADITNNTASSGEGGGFNNAGIVLFSGTTNITGNRTTVGDETAGTDNVGGGFRTSGGNSKVLTATLNDLTASGTPEFTMGTAVINIDNNIAHGRGGGFYATSGIVDLRGAAAGDISISNNSIDQGATSNERRGGGFWVSSEGTQVRIDNGVIDHNISPRDGGGFYMRDGVTVTLNNTDITNNTAFLDGGGFHADYDGDLVVMTGGTISGNTAGYDAIAGLGNSDNTGVRGGGFSLGGQADFTDVTVSNNLVDWSTGGNDDRRGGGAEIEGTARFNATNVTFDGNQSHGIGAGLYVEGKIVAIKGTGGNGLSVLNSSNSATASDIRRDGAGVYFNGSAYADWEGGSISGNITSLHGAGVRLDGSANVTFREVTISNNKTVHNVTSGGAAETDTNAIGAGLYGEGPTTLVMIDSTVSGNIAEGRGGGMYFGDTEVTLVNTDVTGNFAGATYDSATQTINQLVTANGNAVNREGGGIWASSETRMSITGGEISNNVAWNGGGLELRNNTITTLDDVDVKGNIAFNGGALRAYEDAQITLQNGSLMDGNVAVNGSGGGFVLGTRAVLDITDSSVARNYTANGNGGAGYLANSSILNLTNSSVVENIANGHGAGIFGADDSKTFVTKSQISDNLAGYLNDGVTFGAVSDKRGGGMWLSTRAEVHFVDSEVSGNEAHEFGGGINMENDSILTSVGSLFSNNVAGNYGGAIRYATNATVDMINSTISGNYAGFNRAAYSGTITFDEDNRVGGGIWSQSDGNVGTYNHVTITDNHSTSGSGGGVYLSGLGVITLENSIVFNNYGNAETASPNTSDTQNQSEMILVGMNIIGGHGGNAFTGGGTRITDDPKLLALADNGGLTATHAFVTGDSSAENAAVSSTVVIDQRNGDRSSGGVADIGAFELGATLPAVSITNLENLTHGAVGEVAKFTAALSGAGTLSWDVIAPSTAGTTLSGTSVNFTPSESGVHTVQLSVNGGPVVREFTFEAGTTATVNNESELRAAIAAFNGGSTDMTVTLNTSTTLYTFTTADDLDITNRDRTLVLQGNGTTAADTVIDGANLDRVFEVGSFSHLLLRNLTVTGGQVSAHGAGILVSDANLTLDNVILDDNETTGTGTNNNVGGAMYITGHSNVTADDVTIQNNKTYGRGGGIYIDHQSKLDFTGTTIIANNAITRNSSDMWGGGFWASGNAAITATGDLTIINNDAASGSGGFHMHDDASLDASTATSVTIRDNNENILTDSNAHGAGFWAAGTTEVKLNNATISSNGAVDRGAEGGGFRASSLSTVTITGGSISDNLSRGAGGGFRAADQAVVNLINVNITGNSTDNNGQGGGFYSDPNAVVTLNGGKLEFNTADGSGDGGGFYSRGRVDITGVDIQNNTTGLTDNDAFGGGFFATGNRADINLIDVNILNNSSGDHGGGFWASNYADIDFTLSTNTAIAITGNVIGGNNGYGGGFHARDGASVSIEAGGAGQSVDLNGNQTWQHGGAFYVHGAGETVITSGIQTAISGYDLSDQAKHPGNDGSGAGFFVDTWGKVTLENIDITGNTAEDEGGGFYVQYYGSVTINNGDISGNASNGELNTENENERNRGGGFFSRGVVNLNNGDITGNQTLSVSTLTNTQYNGGGFFQEFRWSKTTITNGSVTDNDARGHGGGFYVRNGEVSISSTTGLHSISGNENITTSRTGGGFFASGMAIVTIDNVQISNNTANDDGGGFYATDDTFITVKNTSIEQNTLSNLADGAGFYVVGRGHVVLDNVSLKNNTATRSGGGFRLESRDGTVEVLNGSTISGNQSTDNDGGAIHSSGKVVIKDSTLTGNLSNDTTPDNDTFGGGAIYSAGTGSGLVLENVTLNQNSAYGRGGAIFMSETTADFSNVTVEENVVLSTLRPGGGIWAGNDTDLNWIGGSLSKNIATEDGGGMATGSLWSDSEAAGTINLVDVDIKDNTAGRMGGGFIAYRSNTTLNISSTTGAHEISGNDSLQGRDGNFDEGGGGGAIWGGRVTITDVDIKNNKAASEATGDEPQRGGGLMIRSTYADVTLNNVDLSGNEGGDGGGIWNWGGVLTMNGGSVTNHTAAVGTQQVGGGIGLRGISENFFNGITVDGNTSSSEGGGIWAGDNSITVMNDSAVTNNKTTDPINGTANRVGGGIRITSDSLFTANRSQIDNNESFGRGGGIYNDGILTLTDTSVSGNIAHGNDENLSRGGGIWSSGGDSELTMDRVTVANNLAYGNYGGGLAFWSGEGNITNSTFSGNSAGLDNTGAIAFSDNSYGGAIRVQDGGQNGSYLNLNHVTVTGNKVTSTSGAGVYINSGIVTIENSILYGNFADVDSGTLLPRDLRGSHILKGFNIIGDYRDGTQTLYAGASYSEYNPGLGALSDNGGTFTLLDGTHLLTHAPGSGAIDAAIGSTATVDQRGTARPIGGSNDVGAVEYLPAEIADDTATTDEDTPLSIDPLANDTEGGGGALSINTVTSPSGTTVTINPNGTSVTFDPNGKYNYLAAGEFATETFYYGAQDSNQGISDPVTFFEENGIVVGLAINHSLAGISSQGNSWTKRNQASSNPDGIGNVGGAQPAGSGGSITGDFLQVPEAGGVDTSGTDTPPFSDPYVEYKINISTTGTYELFLRGSNVDGAQSGGTDSIFASIVELQDGTGGAANDWYGIGMNTGGNFQWKGGGAGENTGADNSGNATFTFATAGTYTLRIMPREDGVALDAWALVEASANPSSVVTINSGEVGPEQSQHVTGLPGKVTVTITGVNDAPVITDGPDTVTIPETDSTLTATGALTVSDVDTTDVVTASAASVSVISGSDNGIGNGTLLSMLTVTPTAILGNTETTGSLAWNFNSGSEAFNYLAAGESVVLQYTVQATDDAGTPLSGTETVTITINGTNDAPVISNGPDVSNLTANGGSLTDSGNLTVSDSDVTDVVTSLRTVAISGPRGILTSGELETMLTISPATTLNGTQVTNTLTWNFNSGVETFAFLGEGESLVLTYTVTATDDDGTPLSDAETITVTINGANTAPVITDGPDAVAIAETNSTLTGTGTLTVSDANTSDLVTARVASVAVNSGSANGISNAALLAMMTVAPTAILDGTESSDTLTWNFNSGTEAFNYLAAGESVVLEYTVEATDDAIAPLSGSQTVTITINGTNDTPTVSTSLFDSANGIGMDPRFGLTETVAANPLAGESGDVTRVGGDATASYADFYGPAFVSLVANGLTTADSMTFSAELLSTANPGATSARLQIRFYSEGAGNLDYGAGGNFSTRVERFGNFADLGNVTSFQQLLANVEIPDVDTMGNLITRFEYAIQLPQSGEDNDQGNNSVVAPYELYIRNISLLGNPEPATSGILDVKGQVTEIVNGGAGEGTSNLSASGSFSVGDLDLSDVQLVSVTGGLTTRDGGAGALLGVLTPTVSDNTTTDGTGLISWTFSVNDADIEFLAEGETITQTYTLTVNDQKGGTVDQTVTVTITGANDAPVISDGPDTASLTANGGGLSASGSLTVTDLDVTDLVTSSLDSLVISGPQGSLTSGDLEAMLTLNPTATLNGAQSTNSLGWTFNSGAQTFAFLSSGESLILTYTVQAVDDAASPLADIETITVTINGTNTPPVAVDDSASAVENGSAVLVDVLANDSDANASDTLSILPSSLTTSAHGIPLSVSGGKVSYDTSASTAFDHLAAGETIVDTFTYAVTDAQQGTIYSQGFEGGGTLETNGFTQYGGATQTVKKETWSSDPLSANEHGVWLRGDLPDQNGGFYQDVSAMAGESYTFDASFRIEPNFLPNGGSLAMELVYLDASGAEISRNTFDVGGSGVPSGSFDHRNVSGTAPVGTAIVRSQIHWTTDSTIEVGGNTAVLIDNMSLTGPSLDTATVTVTVTGVNDLPVAIDDSAPFTAVFTIGANDNSTAELVQENGSSNPGPGAPGDGVNDDFYIGDPDNTFERALTASDPTNRIHFNLTPAQAVGEMQLLLEAVGTNIPNGAGIKVYFNGTTIYDSFIRGPHTFAIPVFSGSSVGAVAGANTITITGDIPVGNWVPFDYVQLNVAGSPYSVTEDDAVTTATGNVLANDFDIDVNGWGAEDSLSVISVNNVESGVTAISGSTTIAGAYGSLLIDAAGNFTYTLNNLDPDTNVLDAGDTVQEVFTYTVFDQIGTDTATLTLNINGSNDVSIANNDVNSATEAGGANNATAGSDATGNVMGGAGVSGGDVADTDVDGSDSPVGGDGSVVVSNVAFSGTPFQGANTGGAVAITGATLIDGAYGTLTIQSNGSYTYAVDPVAGDALDGGDSVVEVFTYTIVDGNEGGAGGAAATLTITVNGVNDNPVLSGIEPFDIVYLEGNGPVQITNTVRVDDGDAAPDADNSAPHPANTDGLGDDLIVSATVQITNNYVNTEDVLAISGTLPAGITASAFDSIAGRITLSGNATIGSYEAALRLITYENTNAADPDVGTRSIVFTVNDHEANSNTVTRSIRLSGVNDAPVANDDVNAATEAGGVLNAIAGTPASGNVLITSGGDVADTDPEGDSLRVVAVTFGGTAFSGSANSGGAIPISGSVTIDGAYGTLVISRDGSYTYTVNEAAADVIDGGDSPVDVFSYVIADSDVLLEMAAWDFTGTGAVNNVQDWSVINGDAYTGTANGGDGLGAGTPVGGHAYDDTPNTYAPLVASSPNVIFNSAPTGAAMLKVTFYGGAGDQNNRGQIYDDKTPADVINEFAGSTGSTGQKGLALFNVATGTYDATFYKTANSSAYETLTLTGADLTGAGVNLDAEYQLHYFDNDSGGWGWTKLARVSANAVKTTGVGIDSATLAITVNGANDNPVATRDTANALEAGGVANATPGVNPNGNVITDKQADSDLDGDDIAGTNLSISNISFVGTAFSGSANSGGVVAGPTLVDGAYGTLSINLNGSYTYNVNQSVADSLDALDSVTENFTYTLSDPQGGITTNVLHVILTGANDAPVANNDAASATENGGVANATIGSNPGGNVLTTGPGADSDPDADDVIPTAVTVSNATYTGGGTPVGSNAGGVVSGATLVDGQFGTLTINPDGSYNYVLDQVAADSLNAGDTPTEVFTYTITDTAAKPANWNFAVNDLQGWSVLSGNEEHFTSQGTGFTALVLPGSAFRQDGGHETFLMSSPTFRFDGSTLDGTNVLSIVMGGGQGNQSATAAPANPAAVTSYNSGISNASGQKGAALFDVATGQYLAVYYKATSGGQETISLTSADLSGAGANLVGGEFQVHYFDNDEGSWGWTQINRVQAAGTTPATAAASATATLTITVNGANDAPVAVDDNYTATNPTDEDTVLTIPANGLLGNDTDIDDAAVLKVISNDAISTLGATVTVNSDGSFSYDPRTATALQDLDDGQTIVDTFTYTITDASTAPDGLMRVNVINTTGTNPGTVTANWLNVWNAIDAGATTGTIAGYNVVNNTSDTETVFDYPTGGSFGVNNAINSISGDGPGGSGGPFNGGDNYSIRAQSYLQFSIGGTYTIAMGSDDGRLIELTAASPGSAPGFSGFSARNGQVNGAFTAGDTEIGFTGGTGHQWTLGTFTVAAGDVLSLDAFYYEGGGGDSGEIAIASGTVTSFSTSSFALLQNGVLGLNLDSTDPGRFNVPTSTATVSIRVNGVNDQVDAVNDLYVTDQNTSVTGQNLFVNDTDADNDPGVIASTPIDTDDPKTVTAVNGVGGAVGNQVTLPSGAQLTVNANGTFTYNPNGAFDYLGSSERALDSFTYTITDNDGVSAQVSTDTATVTIEINGRNDLPSANNDSYTVLEDGTVTTDGTSGLLANDTDIDTSDQLVVTSTVTNGLEGTLVANTTGGNDGGLLATFVDLNNDFGGSANDIRVDAKPAWMMLAPQPGEEILLQAMHRLGMVPKVADVIVPELDFPNNTTSNPYATDGSGNSIAPGLDVDQVAAYFKGKIQIATAGTYTFAGNGDDGVVIYIDGQLVVNRNQDGGFSGNPGTTGTFTFAAAGQYDILVGHYEGGGGAGLLVQYSGPDNSNTMGEIPPSALFNDVATPGTFVSGGLRGNFFDTNNNDVGGPTGDNSTNFAGNAAPYLLLDIPDGANVLLEAVFSQAFANNSDIFVPFVDFGAGTDEATGDGTVIGRVGTTANAFGGLQQATGSGTDVDQTAVILTGYLDVPHDGDYTFTLYSDDGAGVFINGQTAVLRTGGDGSASGAALTLTKGLNEIKIVHFEGTGGARLQVGWSGPGLTGTEVLGPKHLSTTNSAGGDGSFTYDTNGQFDYLAAGESAVDIFAYTAADHDGLSDTATASITVTGVNDPVVVTAAPDLNVGEGQTVFTNLVTFTDLDLTDFGLSESEVWSVTIDWGDGTSTTLNNTGGVATVTKGASNGTDTASLSLATPGVNNLGDSATAPTPNAWNLTGTHTYADNGVYQTAITISDGNGSSVTINGASATTAPEITVNNALQTFTSVTGTPSTGPAAGSPVDLTDGTATMVVNSVGDVTVDATFSDPGFSYNGGAETFTGQINWGDGTGVETVLLTVIQGSSGTPTSVSFTSPKTHTYTTGPVTHTVRIQVADDDMSGDFTGTAGLDFSEFTFSVFVDNVPPALSFGTTPTITEGSAGTFTGTITDPGAFDTQVLTVDFGDPNSPAPEIFTFPVSNTLSIGDTVTGSKGTILIVTGLTSPQGKIDFSFEYTYVDDGLVGVGGTTSDTSLIRASVTDGLSTPPGYTGNVVDTSVTILNQTPALSVTLPFSQILQPTTVTGTFTDTGLQDVHIVGVDWADGTAAKFTVPGTGSGLAAGTTIPSTTDGSVLKIESVDPVTGKVTFSVTHIYTVDGIYQVAVSVGDDDGAVTGQVKDALVYFLAPNATGSPGFFTNVGENALSGISNIFRDLPAESVAVGFIPQVVQEGPSGSNLFPTPFFSGFNIPGSNVNVAVRDGMGNVVASQSVATNTAGGWGFTFAGLNLENGPFTIEVLNDQFGEIDIYHFETGSQTPAELIAQLVPNQIIFTFLQVVGNMLGETIEKTIQKLIE